MNMATQEDFDFKSFKKEAIAGLFNKSYEASLLHLAINA
jgi:hypothetical protein